MVHERFHEQGVDVRDVNYSVIFSCSCSEEEKKILKKGLLSDPDRSLNGMLLRSIELPMGL